MSSRPYTYKGRRSRAVSFLNKKKSFVFSFQFSTFCFSFFWHCFSLLVFSVFAYLSMFSRFVHFFSTFSIFSHFFTPHPSRNPPKPCSLLLSLLFTFVHFCCHCSCLSVHVFPCSYFPTFSISPHFFIFFPTFFSLFTVVAYLFMFPVVHFFPLFFHFPPLFFPLLLSLYLPTCSNMHLLIST